MIADICLVDLVGDLDTDYKALVDFAERHCLPKPMSSEVSDFREIQNFCRNLSREALNRKITRSLPFVTNEGMISIKPLSESLFSSVLWCIVCLEAIDILW